MKAVIMAGGMGTRISELFPDVPKPLIPIGGVPVLQREIENLRDQGITDIILTVSWRAYQIVNAFRDGRQMGVHLTYYFEENPMGNTGALFHLRDQLTEPFLLLTADNVFDVDFHRMIRFHESRNALVTILARPTTHPYDCGLLQVAPDGSISHWYMKNEPRPSRYRNRVNSGIHLIDPAVLDMVGVKGDLPGTMNPDTGEYCKVDLDRDLLAPLCETHRMFCYYSSDYCRDMGTPERYESVCRDLETGVFEARRSGKKRKVIFLPLDQILISSRSEQSVSLLSWAADMIHMIDRSGYYAAGYLPAAYYGHPEIEDVREMTDTLLGENGAYLDGIYIGKEAENSIFPEEHHSDLRTWAETELNAEMADSWMLASADEDIVLGRQAGCRVVEISSLQQHASPNARSMRHTVEMILWNPALSVHPAPGGKERDTTWKTLHRESLVSNRYVSIDRNIVELPDGCVIPDYYTVTIPDAVAIVAVTAEGDLVLKTEYRYACRENLIELPAGCIEEGETTLQAAQRELLEETGYASDDWTYLVPSRECTAKLTNTMHLFFARGCRKVAEQHLDPTENLEIMLIPFQEAVKMIYSGQIKCCSTAHGILMAQALMR